MESLIAPSINLIILIFFLFIKLKKPIRDFVAQRHVSIRDEIYFVRDQLNHAQGQYNEFSAQLKTIDGEIVVLKEQTRQDTAQMKRKIIAEATRGSGLIISDAKNAAEGLYFELRRELYSDLSVRILSNVEKNILKDLTKSDQSRVQQEFFQQVEVV